eukprot:TRINITY_DN6175_c0_g1_i1.p1 TRINITY_DN6175_c0_g1~~TRINITY_DN6175_c0_g1_i1.p1  ORF type:complete len:401 (-),score=66.16 TRINITY_DN6175_c0_g1_i1:113-1315(-)
MITSNSQSSQDQLGVQDITSESVFDVLYKLDIVPPSMPYRSTNGMIKWKNDVDKVKNARNMKPIGLYGELNFEESFNIRLIDSLSDIKTSKNHWREGPLKPLPPPDDPRQQRRNRLHNQPSKTPSSTDTLPDKGGVKVWTVVDPSRSLTIPITSHWVPSTIEVSESGVKITSEISGLPLKSETKPIYHQLELILADMIPHFSKIGVTISQKMKVIVKIQKYVVEEGQVYEGNLHREGSREDNIEAVGIYYPHVDETIEGGSLHLVNVMSAGCGSKIPSEESTPGIKSGWMVVFKNSLYHKVGVLGGKGSRWMISFFLVSEPLIKPDHGLASSDQVIVNAKDKVIQYIKVMEEETNVTLPTVLHDLISEYVLGNEEESYSRITEKLYEPVHIDSLQAMAMD